MQDSIWIASSPGIRFEPLSESIETDILIIGGGLTGISTAHELSNSGLNITLIESDQVGYGTSGRSTGKLTPQCGLIYNQTKKYYGLDKVKALYDQNVNAFNKIKANITNYHIDCDFTPMPSFIFSKQPDKVKSFEDEYRIYEELGIEGTLTRTTDLPFDVEIAISQSNTGVFNPKKYIDGLVPILTARNVKIYEHTPVTDIHKSHSDWKVLIRDGISITARQVILCSHYPFYDNYSLYPTRLRPEKSYLVAGKYSNDLPKSTFIDEDNAVRSFCPYQVGDETWLLIGGENHKVGQSQIDHYKILMDYGKEVFGLSDYSYKWSAQGYVTPDALPYIGFLNEHTDHMYVATGFNKWGNLNSTIAAHIISDLILNHSNNDVGVYDPSRKRGYFTAAYVSDNINTLYEWVKSKITSPDEALPAMNDTATVVSLDGRKYGAYKDTQGELHIVDITCSHVGAELNWNQIERTWDCPCHGSRFSYDGDLIEGPATHKLRKYLDGKNIVDPHILQK